MTGRLFPSAREQLSRGMPSHLPGKQVIQGSGQRGVEKLEARADRRLRHGDLAFKKQCRSLTEHQTKSSRWNADANATPESSGNGADEVRLGRCFGRDCIERPVHDVVVDGQADHSNRIVQMDPGDRLPSGSQLSAQPDSRAHRQRWKGTVFATKHDAQAKRHDADAESIGSRGRGFDVDAQLRGIVTADGGV